MNVRFGIAKKHLDVEPNYPRRWSTWFVPARTCTVNYQNVCCLRIIMFIDKAETKIAKSERVGREVFKK